MFAVISTLINTFGYYCYNSKVAETHFENVMKVILRFLNRLTLTAVKQLHSCTQYYYLSKYDSVERGFSRKHAWPGPTTSSYPTAHSFITSEELQLSLLPSLDGMATFTGFQVIHVQVFHFFILFLEERTHFILISDDVVCLHMCDAMRFVLRYDECVYACWGRAVGKQFPLCQICRFI